MTQELRITPLPRNGIRFALSLTGACSRTVTGVVRAADGDVESIDGDDGRMIFVDQYQYQAESGCSLIINIDLDTRKIAQIEEHDCASSCPILDALMSRAR